jgi:hypothetical protein
MNEILDKWFRESRAIYKRAAIHGLVVAAGAILCGAYQVHLLYVETGFWFGWALIGLFAMSLTAAIGLDLAWCCWIWLRAIR